MTDPANTDDLSKLVTPSAVTPSELPSLPFLIVVAGFVAGGVIGMVFGVLVTLLPPRSDGDVDLRVFVGFAALFGGAYGAILGLACAGGALLTRWLTTSFLPSHVATATGGAAVATPAAWLLAWSMSYSLAGIVSAVLVVVSAALVLGFVALKRSAVDR